MARGELFESRKGEGICSRKKRRPPRRGFKRAETEKEEKEKGGKLLENAHVDFVCDSGTVKKEKGEAV